MATIAEKVFEFILEDKADHLAVMSELPAEKRAAVLGRKGRIVVDGPEGGTFIIRLTPTGVFTEEDYSDIRNDVILTDDTLMEILVWLAHLPNNPGLSPRAAYVNGLIRISGDSVLYDAEEIFKVLEKHAFLKMGPIAKEAVEEMSRQEEE